MPAALRLASKLPHATTLAVMALTIGFVFDDTLDALDGVQQHIITIGTELVRRGTTCTILWVKRITPPYRRPSRSHAM